MIRSPFTTKIWNLSRETLFASMPPICPPKSSAGRRQQLALHLSYVIIPSTNCERQQGTFITKKSSCKLARKSSGCFCHPASLAYISNAGPPVPKAPINAPPTNPAQMAVGFRSMSGKFEVSLIVFSAVVFNVGSGFFCA